MTTSTSMSCMIMFLVMTICALIILRDASKHSLSNILICVVASTCVFVMFATTPMRRMVGKPHRTKPTSEVIDTFSQASLLIDNLGFLGKPISLDVDEPPLHVVLNQDVMKLRGMYTIFSPSLLEGSRTLSPYYSSSSLSDANLPDAEISLQNGFTIDREAMALRISGGTEMYLGKSDDVFKGEEAISMCMFLTVSTPKASNFPTDTPTPTTVLLNIPRNVESGEGGVSKFFTLYLLAKTTTCGTETKNVIDLCAKYDDNVIHTLISDFKHFESPILVTCVFIENADDNVKTIIQIDGKDIISNKNEVNDTIKTFNPSNEKITIGRSETANTNIDFNVQHVLLFDSNITQDTATEGGVDHSRLIFNDFVHMNMKLQFGWRYINQRFEKCSNDFQCALPEESGRNICDSECQGVNLRNGEQILDSANALCYEKVKEYCKTNTADVCSWLDVNNIKGLLKNEDPDTYQILEDALRNSSTYTQSSIDKVVLDKSFRMGDDVDRLITQIINKEPATTSAVSPLDKSSSALADISHVSDDNVPSIEGGVIKVSTGSGIGAATSSPSEVKQVTKEKEVEEEKESGVLDMEQDLFQRYMERYNPVLKTADDSMKSGSGMFGTLVNALKGMF
jgi:hypothetical protein